MPVTVKFSEHFYGKFGHEAVDELVNFLNRMDAGYGWELQKLNEQNFARFDAKLEQRLAEFKSELKAELNLDQRLAEVKADLAARFAAVDTGFERLRTEIVAAREHTIRWMFFFIATAVLAILGLG